MISLAWAHSCAIQRITSTYTSFGRILLPSSTIINVASLLLDPFEALSLLVLVFILIFPIGNSSTCSHLSGRCLRGVSPHSPFTLLLWAAILFPHSCVMTLLLWWWIPFKVCIIISFAIFLLEISSSSPDSGSNTPLWRQSQWALNELRLYLWLAVSLLLLAKGLHDATVHTTPSRIEWAYSNVERLRVLLWLIPASLFLIALFHEFIRNLIEIRILIARSRAPSNFIEGGTQICLHLL